MPTNQTGRRTNGQTKAAGNSTEKRTKKQTSNQAKKPTQRSNGTLDKKQKVKRDEVIVEKRDSDRMYDEVILVITLLMSILLVLSYISLAGKVGDLINYLVFGMIGVFAYIFPFVLFFFVAFTISNRGNFLATRKVYSGLALFLITTSLIELLHGYDETVKFYQYFIMSATKKNGGGLLGAVLVKVLCPFFGVYASIVILLALFIICLMLITNKGIFYYLGKKSGESVAYFKEQRELRKLEMEDFNEEEDGYGYEDDYEEELRKKARTVTFMKGTKGKDSFEDELVMEELGGKVSFLDEIKKKGSKETKEAVSTIDDVQNLEQDNVIDEFTITGDFTPSNHLIDEVNSIYKDELEKKFGINEVEDLSLKESKKESHLCDKLLEEEFIVNVDWKQDITTGVSNNFEKKLDSSDENTNMMKQEFVDHSYEEFQREYGSSKGDSTHTQSATNKKDDYADKEVKSHESKSQSIKLEETKASDEMLQINQVIKEEKKYEFPPLDLLAKPKVSQAGMTDKDLKETANKLKKTLESFGVRVTITNISCGPAVTRYELQPEQGVKVSKITGLADDIKLNLAAADVRIEAPIPGKAAVGIEVPNKENSAVMLRELLDTNEFSKHGSNLAFAVGKDIGGQAVVTDIAKMPHLLIAGATGSGKSVCINTLIMSILYKANPSDVRLIMVDPKVVELSIYNGIPHLLIPVVTDPKKASAALNWAVMEMTERYKKFADLGVRDLKSYNERVAEIKDLEDPKYEKLPQIVIIVDELADLMMVAPGEVEDAICRLAQMARAAGLHLIIATQRPSVNVITGLIKANVPSRIAFSVSSAIDSRTIIDGSGAEKLLGKGDMLFFPSGYPKPIRVQGAFVSDKEVNAVVDFLKEKNEKVGYNEEVNNKITSVQTSSDSSSVGGSSSRDEYFIEAGKFIIEKDKASIGMLQRVYKIGFNRAARIMDQLSEAGVVGPEEGTKPRKVIMSLEEFEQYVDEYV